MLETAVNPSFSSTILICFGVETLKNETLGQSNNNIFDNPPPLEKLKIKQRYINKNKHKL